MVVITILKLNRDFWPYQVDLGRDWEVEELEEIEAFQKGDDAKAEEGYVFEWSSAAEKEVSSNNTTSVKAKTVLIGLNGAGAWFLLARFGSLQNPIATIRPVESDKVRDICSTTNEIMLFCHMEAPDPLNRSMKSHHIRFDQNRSVYSLDNHNILLVICQYEVKPEAAWQWTQTLLRHVDGDRVAIFDKFTVGQYQTAAEDLYPPFVRKLESTKVEKVEDNVKPLEPPTVISGPSAAILTHKQARNQSARVYLSLLEQRLGRNEVIVETLKAFEAPLRALLENEGSVKGALEGMAKYGEVLERYQGRPVESNLYI
ncbi:Proteasome assembly chaperone 1 [Rhizophlyctis rosea]|nr:Proteasome assembly chaperone 1 [Rhizophlyctis rosea]